MSNGSIDKLMRNIRHAVLLLLGCSFTLFAIFAFNLGLDPNPGWGKSRALIFSLGILLMAVFADSRFGSAWTENMAGRIAAWFVDIREKIFNRLHIPKEINPPIRNRLIYGSVVFVFFMVVSIYVWFVSAGTWVILPKST